MTIKTKDVFKWVDDDLVRWATGEVFYKDDSEENHLIVATEVAKRLGLTEEQTAGIDDLISWARTELTTEKQESEMSESNETPETKSEEVIDSGTLAQEVAPEETSAPAQESESAESVDSSVEESTEEEPAASEEEQVAPITEAIAAAKDPSEVIMDTIKSELKAYVDKMSPGVAHAGKEGAIMQVKLYRIILTVLRQTGSNFNKTFGVLLEVVNANRKGCFSERYLFRYFDNLSISSPERKNLERILNLLITTCDPATRGAAIKQVDIDATMEGFKSTEMHQRVIGFYNEM